MKRGSKGGRVGGREGRRGKGNEGGQAGGREEGEMEGGGEADYSELMLILLQVWRFRPAAPSTTVRLTTLPMAGTARYCSMTMSARLTSGLT